MTRPKFIIWALSFDDTSGGVIALHLLCRRLNEMGEQAFIWEPGRPALRNRFDLKEWVKAIRYEVGRTKRAYSRGPFNNPVARRRDLKNAIVVYPEIIEGNPLGSKAVVRWLLHRPGHHTGKAVFGPDDLFFFYQDAFDDPRINSNPENRLTLTWLIDAYREQKNTERSGSAYLLRKGKGRPLVHDLENSICVDELSHAERAAVFNQVEYFYSYDLYTMYSRYAALCGCIPIIVPDPAITKEQWVPREDHRYGLAYGSEEIPWAIATHEKLLEQIRLEDAEQELMLRHFVAECAKAFS
jgi:hypothetical protein